MKAVIVIADREAGIEDRPVPSIPDGAVLVKVKALAINPTDWKHVDGGIADVGALCGCDFSGVVEDLGAGVTDYKKGDRIFGVCHGGNRVNHNDGAFAEYIIVKPGPRAKTPDNLSDEQAASLGVAVTTVGQGLYKCLGLPLPTQPAPKPFPIFIYGGSTSTGTIGIQMAKASGLSVITTSSPRNFDYLRSLGADLVVDYNSPTLVQDIRNFSGGAPQYAWNCIGGDESDNVCDEAVGGDTTGKISSILNSKKHPWTLGYDVLGETYEWANGEIRHGKPEELQHTIMFWAIARQLLADGTVQPIRVTVNRGGSGLEGVLHGMNEVKNGRVSAEKLVYTL